MSKWTGESYWCAACNSWHPDPRDYVDWMKLHCSKPWPEWLREFEPMSVDEWKAKYAKIKSAEEIQRKIDQLKEMMGSLNDDTCLLVGGAIDALEWVLGSSETITFSEPSKPPLSQT